MIILLGTGGANGGGYMASKYVLVAIYGVILILHGLINCLPIHWLSWFGHLGVFWNTAGIYLQLQGDEFKSLITQFYQRERERERERESLTTPMHALIAWIVHAMYVGVFVMVILLPAVAKERASVEFIFTHFNTENGMGIHDKAYILFVGLLMSQYSLLGYDTSAHMVINIYISSNPNKLNWILSIIYSE